jgi:carotenoid cleavage dioxygenase-like enzyme
VPWFTALQRLDTRTGEMRVLDLCPDLPGEPVLAPAAGSEGWLLSLVNRAGGKPSQLLVLRASDLGIQARVTLPFAVPIGFHGCWVPRHALPAG